MFVKERFDDWLHMLELLEPVVPSGYCKWEVLGSFFNLFLNELLGTWKKCELEWDSNLDQGSEAPT